MALYPPIIDSSKAMQLISENPANTVKVYYNSKNSDETEAAYYLASAINPRTGENILDSGEMALCGKKSDDDGKYIEVELASENTIAQITLYAINSSAQSSVENAINIYDWYLDNKTKVSISSSAVIFKLFKDTISLDFSETSKVINASPFRFTVPVGFSKNSTDELAWYRIKLRSGSNILAQTDKCYPKSKNAIDEIINYDFNFKSTQTYQFDITIGTKNGIIREFTKNGNWSISTNGVIITPDSNLGTVVIDSTKSLITVTWTIDKNNLFTIGNYFASLYIQKNGFWRKVGLEVSQKIEAPAVSLSFSLTPTNNRAGKYRVVLKQGTIIRLCSNEFWYSTYGQDILLKQDAQTSYLIKYNPEINQVKRNIVDVITPTLGAKYPFIYRNGHQNYRTFTIGGLIARYDNTKDVTYIGTDEDIIQERLYREDLLDFLYNDKVKLFSSAQEGEMLIKLSGVSVTPMKQLGRMLYSFSATATEIADCTEENLKAFGIER